MVSEMESAASVEGGIYANVQVGDGLFLKKLELSYLGEVYIAFGIEYNYVKCLSL